MEQKTNIGGKTKATVVINKQTKMLQTKITPDKDAFFITGHHGESLFGHILVGLAKNPSHTSSATLHDPSD